MNEPQVSFQGPQWFCIIVEANCHRQVENALMAIGYRAFLPKLRKWVSHARVRKAVERPVLGRYMFVEVDYPRQSFEPVASTAGVSAIISAGGVPWPMPRADVEDLLHRYMAGEFDEIANGPLPIGARVAILAGKFENWIATVTEHHKGNRMTLKLLGTRDHVNGVSARNVRPAFGSDLARDNSELEAV